MAWRDYLKGFLEGFSIFPVAKRIPEQPSVEAALKANMEVVGSELWKSVVQFETAHGIVPYLCFDEECFGWVRDDKERTFDPLPMPREWRSDQRGSQIEESRRKRYHLHPSKSVYADGAKYPSKEEANEVVMAAWARSRARRAATN